MADLKASADLILRVQGLKDTASTSAKVYFVLTLLNEIGAKIGQENKSKTHKLSSLGTSAVSFPISLSKDLVGIALRAFTKGFFTDKLLGLVTVKFSSKILSGELAVDDWFPLSTKSKTSKSAGKVNLKLSPTKAIASKPTEADSDSDSEEEVKKPGQPAPEEKINPLKVSSKWAQKDQQLKTSAFVVVEEDDDEELTPDPIHLPAPGTSGDHFREPLKIAVPAPANSDSEVEINAPAQPTILSSNLDKIDRSQLKK